MTIRLESIYHQRLAELAPRDIVTDTSYRAACDARDYTVPENQGGKAQIVVGK